MHVGIQRTSRVALQGAGADPRMNGAGASGWRAEEAGLGGVWWGWRHEGL